jgi:sodium-dependent dicarboxylate transporter 2/3/5
MDLPSARETTCTAPLAGFEKIVSDREGPGLREVKETPIGQRLISVKRARCAMTYAGDHDPGVSRRSMALPARMMDTDDVARESDFGRARRVGLLLGPLAAAAVYIALPSGEAGLANSGHAVAAVGTWMAIWWMTEALPLAVTSLLPLVLFPLLGVTDIAHAAAPYADKVVFLFMGGFMLALCVEKWGLHRRIALLTVRAMGTKQTRLVGGIMAATAFLSMWLSNTATAAMMLPIGMSLVSLSREGEATGTQSPQGESAFGTAMMLGIAYAASLGGMGTPIGTPPNVILIGYLEKQGMPLGFAQWMTFGVPLAAITTLLAWGLLVFVLHPLREREIGGGRELMARQLGDLGPVTRGEWIALSAFALAVTLWIGRSLLNAWHDAPQWAAHAGRLLDALDDSGIAIGTALLLFAIPVNASRGEFALDWQTAARLPWHVLLLFGGGLSLAAAMASSGLDAWIGRQIAAIGTLPLVVLVASICFVTVMLSELASNTATAATFLPIVGGVAVAAQIDPAMLTIAAALAASCGFMLPVATPPNAIVFGTGKVRIAQMARAGLLLDVCGVVLITAATLTLVRWVT